jgi:hypothetical protein
MNTEDFGLELEKAEQVRGLHTSFLFLIFNAAVLDP